MKLSPSQRNRVLRLTARTFQKLLKLTSDPDTLAVAVTRMAQAIAKTRRRFDRKGR